MVIGSVDVRGLRPATRCAASSTFKSERLLARLLERWFRISQRKTSAST